MLKASTRLKVSIISIRESDAIALTSGKAQRRRRITRCPRLTNLRTRRRLIAKGANDTLLAQV